MLPEEPPLRRSPALPRPVALAPQSAYSWRSRRGMPWQRTNRNPCEVLNVTEGLRFGLAQVLAEALVFHQQDARPEQVNIFVVAGKILDGFFKREVH